MAKCDDGYPCEVCHQDVTTVTDSDLYLRYILGEVALEQLHLAPERHLRCNPALAQYIVHPQFEPVHCEGPFAKEHFAAPVVSAEETRITQAWRRLQAIPKLGLAIPEYPLALTPFAETETPM